MLSQHRSKGNKTKLMINISRQSLCDDTLLSWLATAFKAAKLPSDAIVFQSNEVDVTSHLNAAKAFAEGLQKLKTMLSISNFGCSLNPFNTLTHVPAGIIKIDGSFTTDIQTNSESPDALIRIIYDSRLCAPAILSILSLKNAPIPRNLSRSNPCVPPDNPCSFCGIGDNRGGVEKNRSPSAGAPH